MSYPNIYLADRVSTANLGSSNTQIYPNM